MDSAGTILTSQVVSSQVRSNEVKFDSDQGMSSRLESSQVRSGQMRSSSSQIKSSVKSTRVKSSQIKSGQCGQVRVRSSHVIPLPRISSSFSPPPLSQVALLRAELDEMRRNQSALQQLLLSNLETLRNDRDRDRDARSMKASRRQRKRKSEEEEEATDRETDREGEADRSGLLLSRGKDKEDTVRRRGRFVSSQLNRSDLGLAGCF